MLKKIALLFLLFYSYAVLRYHVGKGLGQEEILFVVNKAFAWTAGTCFALTLLPKKWFPSTLNYRKQFGLLGYGFSLLHITANIILINATNYPLLFEGNYLNSHGWQLIILGILTISCFSLPLIATIKKLPAGSVLYKFGKIGVLTSIIHVSIIGIHGWFTPLEWPYYLPPITLLFVITASSIVIYRSFSN
ncbi:MAG: hypothetical protein K9I37_05390 [Crocinitomicaceae bacterium]|nr:hypothetical protein [Crocinitomicaceae bacterium]